MRAPQDSDPEVRDWLAGRRLIVVSNREPYAHRTGKRGMAVERPTGGLVAALDPVMQAVSGTWIAWGHGDADFRVTDASGRVQVPPDAPRYTLRRIALTRAEVAGFYYGYANQALWPLCHMAMDKARFRRRSWETYQAVNKRFADAAADEAAALDAIVWIHDYHLACCARYLRRMRPGMFLMHFWHIPWPAWDVFRACPQSADLLDGLLANDLLALQHPRHVQNFLECAGRELGARVDAEEEVVEYGGRLTHVKAIPISVDYAALNTLAQSRSCARWMARLRRTFRLEGGHVAVGVDRLDYTKGIPERLRALDTLFHRWPQYRSRVVFIQKCAPSRTQIQAYRDLQARVEEEIARLNAAYGTDDWQPVIYIARPLPPAAMAALYRLADVCIVSSLQDGMNLVAKEFISCQADQRGVLVLSELAGARDELPWAVPVNPYDAEGFAEAVGRALEMPADQRRDRLTHLRAYVAEHDIHAWTRAHLRTTTRLLAARATTRRLLDSAGEIEAALASGEPAAFLLDFDGTLAPIGDEPDSVQLPERVRTLVECLARLRGSVVAIISGRALDDIRSRVGINGAVYAGNHGLEIAGPDWTWTVSEAPRAREAIAACCRRIRQRLRGVPGVLVENKGLTASVHYRKTPHPYVESVRVAVLEEVERAPARTLVVRQGKRVLEIRPDVAWDKGAAARWILARTFGEGWASRAWVTYLGDDRTDEDAFLALGDRAVTVKVGPSTYPTAARYMLRDVDEVYEFLRLAASSLRPSLTQIEPGQTL